jgi:hypothetical protein
LLKGNLSWRTARLSDYGCAGTSITSPSPPSIWVDSELEEDDSGCSGALEEEPVSSEVAEEEDESWLGLELDELAGSEEAEDEDSPVSSAGRDDASDELLEDAAGSPTCASDEEAPVGRDELLLEEDGCWLLMVTSS